MAKKNKIEEEIIIEEVPKEEVIIEEPKVIISHSNVFCKKSLSGKECGTEMVKDGINIGSFICPKCGGKTFVMR